MLIVPVLSTELILTQIQQAEEMLLVAQTKLEVERILMAEAQADEQRATALTEFLKRAEERRNILFPFSSFRDDYISVGFGGIKAGELERYESYLQIVVSNARAREGSVRRLEEMAALLETDILQLKIAMNGCFKHFYYYLAMEDIWWGQSALSNPSRYGIKLP